MAFPPSDPGDSAENQNRQLLALREAALAISTNLSLAETLKRIVSAAATLADARYAALGVPDESGAYLAEFITTGLSAEAEARISHRPRGHGILGVILREGQSLRLRDLHEHPRSYGFPPNHPPMTSFLGVPITRKGDRLGNLYLTDKRSAEEFTDDDQHLIELLAVHAGVAIENARLYARVQHLSVVEERQRIGMDLHDGIIQSIYAVGLTLEYVDAQIGDGELQAAQERLRGAMGALNNTIRDIRAYILDLRPRRFQGDNLVTSLEALLAEFKANTLMMVTFVADAQADASLTPEARLVLFHIAQEALSNVVKHSRASRIDVRLAREDSGVVLSLSDNGRGFVETEAEQRMGHGLVNMRDRAHSVAGSLALRPVAAGGTEVLVTIPAPAP
ncbi:MAG: GAF domain-containing sensor histidine kinase [Anaerolineales bacterium]